ncbi:MAG: ABC transporter ATP-binding protein [Candidatus Hadarchaeum sp.]|uniref:ABC transporter ATP-binding protein n=1 Tax=Candidatus Hadarchaeum sp. TaxID=2883567 RepID=UPI00317FCD1A
MNSDIILETREIVKKFGGIVALNNVNIEIEKGKITGLIGPNGAGKSTLLNVISGFLKPDHGSVVFKGRDVTGWLPHRICSLGLARTFQIVKPFLNFTVEESLLIGTLKKRSGSEAQELIDHVLEYFELDELRSKRCKELNVTQLKRLELARAMTTEPELLLLDEPGAGLNPSEASKFMKMIREINRKKKITILIIEHVMPIIMGLCENVYVLHYGEIIAKGCPRSVCKNKQVINAYLGEKW